MESETGQIRSKKKLNDRTIWTHLDAPDLESGTATGGGKSGMHYATAGLLTVWFARRLAGLHGKSGTRVEGAGRTEARWDCDEHKQAAKVNHNEINIIHTYELKCLIKPLFVRIQVELPLSRVDNSTTIRTPFWRRSLLDMWVMTKKGNKEQLENNYNNNGRRKVRRASEIVSALWFELTIARVDAD